MTQINFNYMPDNPVSIYRQRWQGWRNFYGNDFLSFKDARNFAKKLKLKSKTEWKEYCKSGNKPDNVPFAPNHQYKEKWISWGDFLGTGNIAPKNRNFLSFEEARIFVRKLKLKNQKEWTEYCKSGNKPNNIPSVPNKTYKNKWKGIGDFLGTGIIAAQNKVFLSFKEVRKFARKLKLKNQKEWQKYSKSGNKPDNIPSSPDKIYKNKGWISWGDFLDNDFLSFKEARIFVRKLKLKNSKSWKEYCKSRNKPNNIPSCPNITYKNEWKGYGDFLGTK